MGQSFSKLLHTDLNGIDSIWHQDDEGNVTIEEVQKVGAIVETCKLDYNNDNGNRRDDLHRVASIPMSLYFSLKREGIVDDPKRFKQWLNDRDNRVFRTKGGVV